MSAATCHATKPAVARGLCSACYHRLRRAKLDAASVAPAAPPPRAILEAISSQDLQAVTDRAILETKAMLAAALPEAGRALLATLMSDPRRGHAGKAAISLLRTFPIDAPNGPSRRLLEEPGKADHADGNTQVVIGLHVGASGEVQIGHVVGTVPTPKRGTAAK